MWDEKRLKEIAVFNPRETLKKGAVAKRIAMEQLQPFCRDVSAFDFAAFNGGTKFRNGDTIMARITPCLENGKMAKINVLDEDEVGFGSTEYIVLRAREEIDEDFLYYLIYSSYVREAAIKSMVGSSGRQRVQTSVLENLLIRVPPYREQQKIGRTLKDIDDKIASNRAINKNLEEQAQAIFVHLFSDRPYHLGTLSQIADVIMEQSPRGESYNETKSGALFFQGRADFGFRFPTPRLYTTEPKRMAQAGDVLLSVRAPVGDLNIALEPCCIGRGIAAIRSIDGRPSFLFYCLLSQKDQFDVFNGEGTVFGSINSNALKSMEVRIPPKKLLDHFEEMVAPIDTVIRVTSEEILYLTALRDILLHRLMSGELDVSNIEL